MKNIKDLIPDIETLRREAERYREDDPAPESVEKMTQYLLNNGYREDNPEVFRAIRDYGARELEQGNYRGLFLKGDCGLGKSLGLKLLAAEFGWPVISAVDYESEFMTLERDAFDEFADGLNFFGEPYRVIVIDDLGAESEKVNKYGTSTNVMEYVMDRRYRMFLRNRCRTLVACNLGDEDLSRRYGLRIDSRLDQMMRFVFVTGRSLRQEGAIA